METDLLDCHYYWRMGLAVGAVLSLLLRFVAAGVYRCWREERAVKERG